MKLSKIVSLNNNPSRQRDQSNQGGPECPSQDCDDVVEDEVLVYVNAYLEQHNPSIQLIKERGLFFYKDKESDAILGDFDLKSFEISLKRSNQTKQEFLKDLTYGEQDSSGIFLNLDV